MSYDHRKHEPSGSPRVFAFLIFAAFVCNSCQTPLPPLPNPPGPYTTVRLSPGDVLKLSFAEESDLDQTQKIRRDGNDKFTIPGRGDGCRQAGYRSPT